MDSAAILSANLGTRSFLLTAAHVLDEKNFTMAGSTNTGAERAAVI
jgi:hypothetical protein